MERSRRADGRDCARFIKEKLLAQSNAREYCRSFRLRYSDDNYLLTLTVAILPSLNSIKVGLVILRNAEPYEVVEANFVRMQQRKPVMQTKLRHTGSGKILEYSFKPGESVETAEIEKRKTSYLYADTLHAHFMDAESFEELTFPIAGLDFKAQLLKEGTEVTVVVFKGKILTIILPKKVELKVISAPPGVRGDSAQGGVTKSVEVESGYTLNVPLFIKEGDVLRINTDTGLYVERA